MSPLTRHLLFFAFVGGFLIAAPTVVLYTAGYRWNPGVARLMQTGLLSMESTPAGAQVWVDSMLRQQATPALLKNILPGLHTVELKKDGYLPWKKTLPAVSRETTFAHALLFADEVASRRWIADPHTSAPDPEHGRIATARAQGAWTEIWILETDSGEERLVARLPARTKPLARMEWSTDGSALRAEDGTMLTGEESAFATEKEYVLTAAGDRVSIARLRPPDPPELVAVLPFGSYVFRHAQNNLLLLEDTERERIVLTATEGDQPVLLSVTAKRWAWEPKGRRLLYSDGYDIHVFDPSSGSDQTLTRVSDPLTGLAWHPSGEAAIFSQNERVSALEFSDQGGRVLTTLAEGKGLRDAWVDTRGRSLYFLGTVGKETGLFERLLVK